MNDAEKFETDVTNALGPLETGGTVLPESVSELEERIELLEGDIALLYKAARLASLREQDLLRRLGLRDDTLQSHNTELVTQIPVPTSGGR